MLKRMKKIATLFVATAVMVSTLTACGGNADNGGNNTVTMAGSTSMEKLANALAEGYMTRAYMNKKKEGC